MATVDKSQLIAAVSNLERTNCIASLPSTLPGRRLSVSIVSQWLTDAKFTLGKASGWVISCPKK